MASDRSEAISCHRQESSARLRSSWTSEKCPTVRVEPSGRIAAPATRWPSTKVPLVELRSATNSWSSFSSTMQCERETFESALVFGRETLEELGVKPDDALAISDDIRRRDLARLELQAVEGISAGRHMLHSKPVSPEPLLKPKKKTQSEAEEEESV